MNEKMKEFLLGLDVLTRKTGIAIGGCGCCGSPHLINDPVIDVNHRYTYSLWQEPNIEYIENLEWSEKKGDD